MASKIQDREARQARQRLRDYQARQELHRYRKARRTRDNVIWSVVLVLVVALASASQLFYFQGGPGTPDPVPAPAPTSRSTGVGDSREVPPSSIAQNRTWSGTMILNSLPLGIELNGAAAPQGVSSFVFLTKEGFYNGVSCHRLTTAGIFVLQCGDPDGTGMGGPGYSYGPVENAPADNVYPAGTLAMARKSNDGQSMGSQFFIVYQESTIPADQAGGYTILGRVTSGLDQLRTAVISAGTAADGVAPAVPTTIDSITVQ